MAQYLIDTNVLLRAVAPKSAHFMAAVEAIKRLVARGDELLLAPQVLVEFWVAATRPLDVNGYGWPAADAEAKIVELLRQFPLLPETPAVFTEWFRLITLHGIVGKQAHDARLVALLNVHAVRQLLTFNVGDFQRYGIAVVSPEDVRAD
jgi:predicted nucleic acid-binding protein